MIHRIVTGLFRPKKRKRPSYLTTMICIEDDCGYIWDASNVSLPCPKCASKEVVALSRWAPAKYGMPRLYQGKAGNNG
ncbi:MAG: hypothetical protein L3J69_06000 [Desulfobacula sp.]|nr:hypothetical protein [Desulfobacula sp.]